MLVIVPWHNKEQVAKFCDEWNVTMYDPRFIFEQDLGWKSCAKTKNLAMQRAISLGEQYVLILDDDCFPNGDCSIEEMISHHQDNFNDTCEVESFLAVTSPPSRGTPYFKRNILRQCVASMGFWKFIGDYDAPSQLVHGAYKKMGFYKAAIFGHYFPLCGMNLALDLNFYPWCKFIDVPRFDDIWMGFILQRRAYELGHCFAMNGPVVTHSRQSNVWQNLRDEAPNMELNETMWQHVIETKGMSYNETLEYLGKYHACFNHRDDEPTL